MRYALVLIGAVTTLLVTLVLFGVPVGQLLLGGALTSVFVGIAAQQALSNVFAGLVLLLARPFKVGDSIRLRAGALSGEIDGTVSEIGITYVRLATADGVMSVPELAGAQRGRRAAAARHPAATAPGPAARHRGGRPGSGGPLSRWPGSSQPGPGRLGVRRGGRPGRNYGRRRRGAPARHRGRAVGCTC